jgi:hypothetical protein
MNQTEIQTALELQKQALEFLLDGGATGRIGAREFDESIVDAWKTPDTCWAWLATHYEQFPLAHRPERESLATFALFLSSLLTTSFAASREYRIDGYRLVLRALPMRRLDGTRKSKKFAARECNAADLLRRYGLEGLCEDEGCETNSDAISRVLEDAALADDVTLWAWAAQLVRRSQYASQGPTVYRLWCEIPKMTRKRISAALIWQARQRLLKNLNINYTISNEH